MWVDDTLLLLACFVHILHLVYVSHVSSGLQGPHQLLHVVVAYNDSQALCPGYLESQGPDRVADLTT